MVRHIRVVRVRVMFIEKLYDVESATIYVKMYITLFEVGRHCFPDLYFGMKIFDGAPGGVSELWIPSCLELLGRFELSSSADEEAQQHLLDKR